MIFSWNRNGIYFLLSVLVFIQSCLRKAPIVDGEKESEDLTAYVDPFIGTGGHGHTYPGATVPFGMVQVSPDNGTQGWDWCSGYHYSDSIISGFAQLHLSGTGIGDLADILLMPTNKKVDLTGEAKTKEDLPYTSHFSHDEELARPGYYKVCLKDPKVEVELSASQRTAYHRYNYGGEGEQSIVIDLGFAINWDKPVETAITVEDETTLSGYRHSVGWAKNQKVFFVVKFSKPIVDKVMVVDGIEVAENSVSGTKTAAQFFFEKNDQETVGVKVALSSVSIANAKENMDTPGVFDFESVKEKATTTWQKALSSIQVETEVDSLKTLFYTALYHTQLAPVTFSDKNGEFRKENDSIAMAKNYTAYSTLSLWDTFRAENPLLSLIAPDRTADIIQSMLAYYEVSQSLPVWTLYGNETNTMTGYHSIPVIVEAYFKGIRDFDVEQAYEAIKNTMMQDVRGLNFYKEYGYVPYDKLDENVTYTLEYAYDDWCAAQLAKALGKTEDYQYFLNRSKAYAFLYDTSTGFMRGKSSDKKTWREPFDPKFSRHMENTDYTEGNAWQHSWFVPHDVEGLIKLHGGDQYFAEMLQAMFTESSEITGEAASADISGLIGQYAHGNEPSHHIAYLFNRAGKPWMTQYWVDTILKTQYSTAPDGLSGNEDAGQMSAWYVFSAIGFYPMNPASATYEIGRPIFDRTTINLPNGNTFTVIAEQVSEANMYIQSATLNGEVFNRTTISHEEILQGGKLKFVMGPEPNKNWGIPKN